MYVGMNEGSGSGMRPRNLDASCPPSRPAAQLTARGEACFECFLTVPMAND
jgi:hypothetical protein